MITLLFLLGCSTRTVTITCEDAAGGVTARVTCPADKASAGPLPDGRALATCVRGPFEYPTSYTGAVFRITEDQP